MARKIVEPEPPDDGMHRAADRTDRFACDAALRAQGFTVERRPPGGPVIWRRGDKTYTQADACRIAGVPYP